MQAARFDRVATTRERANGEAGYWWCDDRM